MTRRTNWRIFSGFRRGVWLRTVAFAICVFLGTWVLVALIGGVVFGIGDHSSPEDETATNMVVLIKKIDEYGRQHKAIPSSLAVLPEEGTDYTMDGWHRSFQYSVNNNIITITSLGKDGELGGTGADADISESYYATQPDGSLWVGGSLWLDSARVPDRDQPVGK
jgi:hypothetical protein